MIGRKFTTRMFLFILIPCCILMGENDYQNHYSSSKKNYSILFGVNYSDYLTTVGNGQIGLQFGILKNHQIRRFLILQYGADYFTSTVNLLDKRIRTDDRYTLYLADMRSTFLFIRFKSAALLRTFITEGVFVDFVGGLGFSVNIRTSTEFNNKQTTHSDTEFLDYDYEYAFEASSPMISNSGWVAEVGCRLNTS